MGNFQGYPSLLRQIKHRVSFAQQKAMYAANEELLRMNWDIGEMLTKSQETDGWGKKTLNIDKVNIVIYPNNSSIVS